MNAIMELTRLGGPVMFPILALSVILYSRCFNLLVFLHRTQRRLHGELAPEETSLTRIRQLKDHLEETYHRQRFSIAAMITAAPLLGLLGTVTGMIGTFDALARRNDGNSMENLAGGISEVLICTESGLAVAIPAMLVLYCAHHELQKGLQRLSRLEAGSLGSP